MNILREKMKEFSDLEDRIVVFLVVICSLGVLAAATGKPASRQQPIVEPLPRPRFELLYQEPVDHGVQWWQVWHDKELGIEILCSHGRAEGNGVRPISCFPTGRRWLDQQTKSPQPLPRPK
jgi:hypothetical protein